MGLLFFLQFCAQSITVRCQRLQFGLELLLNGHLLLVLQSKLISVHLELLCLLLSRRELQCKLLLVLLDLGYLPLDLGEIFLPL